MKSFKRYLSEVVRDEKRATKLGEYLAKRHGGHIKFKDHDSPTGDKVYGKAYKKTMNSGDNLHNAFGRAPTKSLPIKDLVATQHKTAFNSKEAKWKLKDNEPVSVVKHKGKHYIVNGHHRLMAHKLLGKTHIDAKVYHLEEVARTPERANKLGHYLVQREKRRAKADGHGADYVKNLDHYSLPAWHHLGTDKEHKVDPNHDDHDMEHFGRAYTNAHSKFYKKKKNIQDVPIKDIMKANHQMVHHSNSYFLNTKMKDNRPMNIARSRKSGELNVIDGFHRMARDWLLGKTHTKANVQDVGYGRRKRLLTPKKGD